MDLFFAWSLFFALPCLKPITTVKLKTHLNRAHDVFNVHQFHDKIDPMLESLERIAERLRQPPSISVEVEKIKEQLAENKSVCVELEKLQPSYETLKQRGEEMIARSEGADRDVSAKGTRAWGLISFTFSPCVV